MSNQPFSFGLITDTHIRPPQGDDSSPYKVNDLANRRAQHAAELLSAQNPDFTIHLGDMVHTLPHLPTYSDACEEAHRIFKPLKPNLHFVAGNHDIGDKPMAISPAGPIDKQSDEIYREHFGDSYHVFVHRDCAFISVNSSLVNTGGDAEHCQKAWLEETLEQNANRRLFVLSHYPPFINSPEEPAHYDNYEEPGRSWFLALMEKHQVEAVFSGHVHQFFYNLHAGTKYYCLPPTSFTRQDYSELYRIGPADEFGRDDRGKFSVAMVHVDDNGHSMRLIPTDGRTDNLGIAGSVKNVQSSLLTVHLRHAWYESIDLPYNGPMEEFSRKRARNDYVLARLWQMGISKVRVPLQDLTDPVSRQRMQEFAATGIRFTLAAASVPDSNELDLISEHSEMIDAFELAICDLSAGEEQIRRVSSDLTKEVSLHIGKAQSSALQATEGTKFAHNVSYGFLPVEADDLVDRLSKDGLAEKIDNVAFQINLTDDLEYTLGNLSEKLLSADLNLTANVRLAPASPADCNFDDEMIAERVESANRLASAHPHISVQIDTFSDMDRGYSPRNGLVDRHYNFRPAGRALSNFS